MSEARNKLIAKAEHIQSLRWIIAFLVIVVIAQWLRNGHLQDVRRIYIPPDLTKGAMTEFESVPPPVVYTFAFYIWQQLHRWKSDGQEDYPKQIYQLQAFLTPGCVNALQADMNNKKSKGELRGRVRSVQELMGHGYVPARVAQQSPESWLTWLDLTIRETIGGHPVKDVNVRYPLRIVRYDVDKEINPWGLAIACDEAMQPSLIEDDELNKPFRPH